MHPSIVECSRGPTIAGSRITVFDVLAETEAGATPEQLADEWELRVEQIQDALAYICLHRDQVLADFRKIEERNARGNPPDLQAKIDAMHAKYQVLWADRIRRMEQERNGEGHPGGQ